MGTRIILFIPFAFFSLWLVFLCALFKTKPTWISLGATAINLLILLLRWPDLPTLSIVGTAAQFTQPLTGLVYFEQGWRTVRSRAGFAGIHAVLIAYLVATFYSNLSSVTSSGAYAFGNELWTVVLRSPILLLLYAIGVILHQRAAVTEAEQERLKYEVEAAAEVQSLLLPSAALAGVEAVYLPASDFPGAEVSMKWLYLVFCSGLMAQKIDLLGAGEPVSDNGVWQCKEADNPAWAGALMLMSDGVVEAANTKRELFGFDRTREISTRPAREIVEAAKAWGQNDDITVVTVRKDA